MPIPTTTQDNLKILRAAILQLLLRSYPAHPSDHDLLAQVARDPDNHTEAINVSDALRQLQADRLIRKHGRYWAASLTAIKAYELLEG